jgi:hypothetical protein
MEGTATVIRSLEHKLALGNPARDVLRDIAKFDSQRQTTIDDNRRSPAKYTWHWGVVERV